MQLEEKEIAELIKVAKETREFAMAFKSITKVGASVLSSDGEIFGGCNIDGVSSGQGSCAERTALTHAVAHGKYRIRALCTYGETERLPCGDCLQFALMFCQISGGDMVVVVASGEKEYEITSVKTLLPRGFETEKFRETLAGYRGGKNGAGN